MSLQQTFRKVLYSGVAAFALTGYADQQGEDAVLAADQQEDQPEVVAEAVQANPVAKKAIRETNLENLEQLQSLIEIHWNALGEEDQEYSYGHEEGQKFLADTKAEINALKIFGGDIQDQALAISEKLGEFNRALLDVDGDGTIHAITYINPLTAKPFFYVPAELEDTVQEEIAKIDTTRIWGYRVYDDSQKTLSTSPSPSPSP